MLCMPFLSSLISLVCMRWVTERKGELCVIFLGGRQGAAGKGIGTSECTAWQRSDTVGDRSKAQEWAQIQRVFVFQVIEAIARRGARAMGAKVAGTAVAGGHQPVMHVWMRECNELRGGPLGSGMQNEERGGTDQGHIKCSCWEGRAE